MSLAHSKRMAKEDEGVISVVKKRLISVVVLLVTISVLALAEPTYNTIKVMYNNIKVYYDMSLITALDAKGDIIEPFVYNGEVYMPIKAVAKAMNKNLSWDKANNYIYLGKSDIDAPIVWLDGLVYFNYQRIWDRCGFGGWSTEKDKDNLGNSYRRGYKFIQAGDGYYTKSKSWQYAEYFLDQQYQYLKGTFVLHYDCRSDPVAETDTFLRIYGDDELLYTSPPMRAGVLPIKFSVDVKNMIKIKIALQNENLNGTLFFGLVDTGLY